MVKITQKQESVSSATMKKIAEIVTLESGLALVDCMITTIHVATKLDILDNGKKHIKGIGYILVQ